MHPVSRPRRPRTRSVLVGLVAVATALLATVGPAAVAGSAAKPRFKPPVLGAWAVQDAALSGGFTIKGKKKPKIVGLTITVLTKDGAHGVDCAPPGAVLQVQGAITLRKGKKFAKSMRSFGHWWLISPQDGPYDNDAHYNYGGIAPLPVKVAVSGVGTVDMLIAGTWDANVPKRKQRMSRFTLLDPAPTGGWCRYDPYLIAPVKP